MAGQIARLAVDGGQSGVRARLRLPGSEPRTVDADPVFTQHPVLPQIAERARHALEVLGATPEQLEVAVGTTGLTPSANDPAALLADLRDVGVVRVIVAHDSVSGYLAANGDAPGVMVGVGTGVFGLAVTPRGAARVDGWGALIGDAGSGYWVGRAGLDAAMRAYDGRGAATVLEDAAVQAFGPLEELYMVLQGDDRRVSRIASFTRTVVESGAAGDQVAAAIVRGAADELATTAVAAVERAGGHPGDELRVSAVGNLATKAPFFRAALEAAFAERGLGSTLAPPLGAPIDGVEQLLDLAPGHPLSALFRTATAG
jgi:N-acetylglucosamine kinase-like BadF-type ATPase